MQHPNWYVIRTKPSSEKKAERSLSEAGFDHYCPWIMERKTPAQNRISHSRRRNLAAQVREVCRPLFKNYIFARPISESASVYALPGMSGIQGAIAFGERYALVSTQEIESIKFYVANELTRQYQAMSKRHNFVIGQCVRLKNEIASVLIGETAPISGIDKAGKVTIEGKSARVVVSADEIEPLE
jgi:transcription antitermination factor NusG